MSDETKKQRAIAIAWWLVLAMVACLGAGALLPSLALLIPGVVLVIVATIWTTWIIARHSSVPGDFAFFAVGFNAIFTIVPVGGVFLNLLGGIRLLRGTVKGGTITTTTNGSSSSSSMKDKKIGSLARPAGALLLILACVQPAVAGFAYYYAQKAAPPNCRDDGDLAACYQDAKRALDSGAAGLHRARNALRRACTNGAAQACAAEKELLQLRNAVQDIRHKSKLPVEQGL